MTPNPALGPVLLLLSMALLAFEIVLLRVFAIETFYHFAHMAIGVALLGFAASGTVLVLLRRQVRRRAGALFEALVALAVPALILGPALADRVGFDATQLVWDRGQWVALLLLYGSLTLPFLVGSSAIVVALEGGGERVGRLYAWNMIGSGLGTLLALVLLAAAPPARALAMTVPVAGLAAAIVLLAPSRSFGRGGLAALLLAGGVWAAALPPWAVQVTPFKGLPQVEAFPDAERTGEAWGPTGWAVAVRAGAFRDAPGLSLAYRGDFPDQVALFVDGETAGGATPWPPDRGAFLHDWLPSSSAYAVGPARSVLVVGSGGGLEVANGLWHDVGEVTGLELVAPLSRVAESAVGTERWIYAQPGVRLVVGDARSFLARSGETFDRVVLPASGVFNATAAGIYSTGEDFLNTVEAYRAYFEALSPNGVAVVSRWLRVPPRDNVKVILTAGEALRRMGREDVGRALVFLRSWATGTLLVKPDGFSEDELDALGAFAESRYFDVDWPPRLTGEGPPFNAIDAPLYRDAAEAAAEGREAVAAFARDFPFMVRPATDDRPYFGSFLRLGSLSRMLREGIGGWLPFAEWGTLGILATLVQSGVLSLLLLGPPLLFLKRPGPGGAVRTARVAAYFSAVGFGYVFIEIAAIQRLGLVLGHPVFATAASLAALLVFSGLGSAVSDRVSEARAGWACGFVSAVALLAVFLAPAIEVLSGLPAAGRGAAGLGLVALPGFLMGGPFAMGLRRLADAPGAVAWAWATNGIASVVGAALAVLLAMGLGGRGLILVGAGCYAVAGIVVRGAR